MSEKEISTYRCTHCLQALPAEEQQSLFAQSNLHPKSDEAGNFIEEAQTMLRFAQAVRSRARPILTSKIVFLMTCSFYSMN